MHIGRRDFVADIGALAVGAIASSATAASARPKSRQTGNIIVRAAPTATHGTLRFAGREYPCMLGRSGIVHPKREGDGGTPAGVYPLREVRYRADRLAQPATGLLTFRTSMSDGWCDDPVDAAYNRLVPMPYHTDAEALWRDDHAYDVLAVIGYNDAPPMPGAGSAIFLHVMRTGADGAPLPTAGCVALKLEDLLAVLAACKLGTMIDIRAS